MYLIRKRNYNMFEGISGSHITETIIGVCDYDEYSTRKYIEKLNKNEKQFRADDGLMYPYYSMEQIDCIYIEGIDTIMDDIEYIMKKAEREYAKIRKTYIDDKLIDRITDRMLEYIKSMPSIVNVEDEHIRMFLRPKFTDGRFITYFVTTIYIGDNNDDLAKVARCTFEELKEDLRICIRVAAKKKKLKEFIEDLSIAIVDEAIGEPHDSFDFE